ncbi:uncharacterized protein TrAFT101_003601 [Trichoderma asperellum]|uniref:uncharacterized protein n=1 Tax=Trichoderma asperellum TaxID=101201 RepID=UPI00331DFDE4|nr:hypothetical protein TrAFT101_003601 [Trichoderma asperellum]
MSGVWVLISILAAESVKQPEVRTEPSHGFSETEPWEREGEVPQDNYFRPL